MAIKIKLEKDGFIKDGFIGYSYTSALLDFWVPAFRLDFNAFVFFFGIYMLEKFLSNFFQIYYVLNYYSVKNTWLPYIVNAGVPIFSFLAALFIAFFYNKYYTKKMLKDGWRPLENDEYSNAILKGYRYLDYTVAEKKDEDKMQRYRSFIDKAKSDEVKKCLGFIILWIIISILFYLLYYKS
ncbi:hypothetical protein [Fusobacterium canifelinum]|uniref:DUF3899 domain-containing protein n=1 Tax=Fusobacterium canifelinum TaxID=285729 RepID=A0ABX7CJR9_9FUSO|nr:hypothetical protein [Fusobacterium canifelinum]QQS88243.1 hypothetical protein I6I83_03680 [Fusobacterium canifelinum]